MPPENAHLEAAREFAEIYARETNGRIETYFKHTSDSIEKLATSMTQMTKALTKYEERQSTTTQRMERLEETIRDQGQAQRAFEDKVETELKVLSENLVNKHQALELQVAKNSTAVAIAKWVAGALFIAMLGGGAIFGGLTGNNQPTTTVIEVPAQ